MKKCSVSSCKRNRALTILYLYMARTIGDYIFFKILLKTLFISDLDCFYLQVTYELKQIVFSVFQISFYLQYDIFSLVIYI